MSLKQNFKSQWSTWLWRTKASQVPTMNKTPTCNTIKEFKHYYSKVLVVDRWVVLTVQYTSYSKDLVY
jgi:hypothetical protein